MSGYAVSDEEFAARVAAMNREDDAQLGPRKPANGSQASAKDHRAIPPMSNNEPKSKNSDADTFRPPEFTDDAIAMRFADANMNRLRYVAALGRWFLWDGMRWTADDTLMVRHLARKICRRISAECNHAKVAKLVASAKAIGAVERLAQADRKLAAAVDQWDADPFLLNTPRGIIDLRTNECRPHEPTDYMTKITGAAPDFDMATPIWNQFLGRVTGDDAELIAFLRRIAGYSLTGSTREHALFFIYGLGANGKSTFLNALTAAAGDYHCTTPIETFTAASHDRHPTELAALRGARLVTATETEEGRRWAESRIKALTGGDKIAARFMRQDFFEFVPGFKLIIAGNHKPGLRSVDEAIRRRFNLVPFTVTIPSQERDERLPEKLRLELPGILAWMIKGCMAWRKQGLAAPPIVTEATTAYLEAEDALAVWIEEAGDRDPSAWASTSDLFGSWTVWATKAGEYVGSQKRFSQLLETRGLVYSRRRSGRGFIGLRLHAPADNFR